MIYSDLLSNWGEKGMKKLFIGLFFLLIPQISFSEDGYWINNADENMNEVVSDETASEEPTQDAVSEEVKQKALDLEISFESLNSCMKTKNKYIHIYGFRGLLCHFRYEQHDCRVSQDLAAKFSQWGLKVTEDMLNGELTDESPEAKKIEEFLSNRQYCS